MQQAPIIFSSKACYDFGMFAFAGSVVILVGHWGDLSLWFRHLRSPTFRKSGGTRT
jgi:hypothetical protein